MLRVVNAHQDGYSAIMLAARGGHTATVLGLVKECGADVNTATRNGYTAVILAVKGGHTATVKVLVQECAANEPQV